MAPLPSQNLTVSLAPLKCTPFLLKFVQGADFEFLFEKNFSKSPILCAIPDKSAFYSSSVFASALFTVFHQTRRSVKPKNFSKIVKKVPVFFFVFDFVILLSFSLFRGLESITK